MESEIVPDHKLKECDLVALEQEVNKKKRKRAKALKTGDMISALSPKTRSEPSSNQARQNNIDGDADLEAAINDQMVVD